MLVAGFPAGSAADLIRQLSGDMPPGANLTDRDAAEFSAAWTGVTRGGTEVHHRMRLFRAVRPQWRS